MTDYPISHVTQIKVQEFRVYCCSTFQFISTSCIIWI